MVVQFLKIQTNYLIISNVKQAPYLTLLNTLKVNTIQIVN